MSLRNSKGKRTEYFYSPKKQPLVRRMILDPNQGNAPSSCYQLRPINDYQFYEQDIIFDPRSSSMKQFSEPQKSSAHVFDRMINQNGISDHSSINLGIFMSQQKEGNSEQNSSQNQFKRYNPIDKQQARKYEEMVKVFRLVPQPNIPQKKVVRISMTNIDNKQKSKIKTKRQVILDEIARNESSLEKNHRQQYCNKMMEQQMFSHIDSGSSSYKPPTSTKKIKGRTSAQQNMLEVKNQYLVKQKDVIKPKSPQVKIEIDSPLKRQIDPQKPAKSASNAKTKPIKKFTQNSEFQLINQYIELMSCTTLIQEMIFVYDKSPIFQDELDFDSQEEAQLMREELKIQHSHQISPQVKIQEQSCSYPQNHQNQSPLQNSKVVICPSVSRNKSPVYSNGSQPSNINCQTINLFDKMRLTQSPESQQKRLYKEFKFQQSKAYHNYYEAIQELKPHIITMTHHEKKMFLELKKQLKEIKDIIDFFEKKNSKNRREHVCKICGEQFLSGRQLGGHMSRKHPGKAFEYGFKKELHKVKQIQRNRRRYFRDQRFVAVKVEHQDEKIEGI